MTVYADLVVLLNFLVDFLLLLGANRLCGHPPGWLRATLAAAVGSVYAFVCLFREFAFLADPIWRLICLGIMSWIAFGSTKSAVRRSIIFVFLSMALGGVALAFGSGGFWSLVAAALVVFLLCVFGFRERPGATKYLPVELNYNGKQIRLTALYDSGNTLRDPVTGKPVLVIGSAAAATLTGLSQHQLERPVEALTQAGLTGLRLIPYRTVGRRDGLLLALQIPQVRIGNWKGSSLVAFAPEGLEENQEYQALTGGLLTC